MGSYINNGGLVQSLVTQKVKIDSLISVQRQCACLSPFATPPPWPVEKASASRAEDLGSIPACLVGIFPDQVIPVT